MTDPARCPHANVTRCPLYVAAHDPAVCGLGCAWGALWEGCAVERGEQDYHHSVAALKVRAARLVALCEWQEAIDDSRAQRERNKHLLGIH